MRCYDHILNLAVRAFLFGSSKWSGEDRADEEEETINLAVRAVSQLSKNSILDIKNR